MLGVGGWLTEEDWASGVVDVLAVAGNGLTVGFHGQLLEVSWESVEVLVERSDEMCLGTEKVGIPHAQETTKNWDVLLKGSLLEVDVHGVGTSKELVEVLESNVDCDTQANG